MPLKPSKHLPKQYNRPVSKRTWELVGRKYKCHAYGQKERVRRTLRRMQLLAERWKKSFLWWLLMGGMGVLVLVIVLLLFSPLLSVRAITIRRLSPRLDIEHVQQVLSPLFGRHLLFLAKNDVKQLLQEGIRDLQEIEIRKDYPSELIVAIRLDPIVARLRIVDPDGAEGTGGAAGSGTDFLTEKGVYVRAGSPQETEGLQTIDLVDWGVRPTPGTELIPPVMLAQLEKTSTTLREQFGHTVERQTVYLRAQEYHVRVDGKELWFDGKSSLEQHLQRYRIFLQSVPAADVKEYIDLRLTDRIVYR